MGSHDMNADQQKENCEENAIIMKAKESLENRLQTSGKHFLAITSIRGLPRIAKRDSPRFIRYTWTIFTISAFSALLYFTLSLYIDYLNYHTTSKTILQPCEGGDFPDVSLCLDVPLHVLKTTPEVFRQKLNNEVLTLARKMESNNSEVSEQSLQNILGYDSATHYIETHFTEIVENFDNIALAVNITCNYMADKITRQCQVEQYPNKNGEHLISKFFHCFRIRLPNDSRLVKAKTILMIEVDLHLPEQLHRADKWFTADLQRQLTLTDTIKVALHPKGSAPNFENDAISDIKPGKMVDIKFQGVKERFKNIPNKPCNTDNSYNERKCQDRYIKYLTIKNCHCHLGDSEFQFSKMGLCRDLTKYWKHSLDEYSRRQQCVKKNSLAAIVNGKGSVSRKILLQHCPKSCRRHRYIIRKAHTDTLRWNIKKHLRRMEKIQKLFRNEEDESQSYPQIKSNHLEKLFYCELKPEDEKCAQKNGTKTKENITEYLTVISRAYVGNDVISQESLIMTTEQLLSQVGGMCSLFVGLTLTVLAELMETIYLASCGENVIKIKPDRKDKQRM